MACIVDNTQVVLNDEPPQILNTILLEQGLDLSRKFFIRPEDEVEQIQHSKSRQVLLQVLRVLVVQKRVGILCQAILLLLRSKYFFKHLFKVFMRHFLQCQVSIVINPSSVRIDVVEFVKLKAYISPKFNLFLTTNSGMKIVFKFTD